MQAAALQSPSTGTKEVSDSAAAGTVNASLPTTLNSRVCKRERDHSNQRLLMCQACCLQPKCTDMSPMAWTVSCQQAMRVQG